MQDMMRKLCCLGLCFCFFFSAGCKEKETLSLQEVTEEHLNEDTKEETKEEEFPVEERKELYVYVCGEVKCPGVYELAPGSRMYTAIQAAGGVTDAADPDYLNQAESLTDGQQIYVPSRQETENARNLPGKAESAKDEKNGKVNLNTAGKDELMTLTGIGEAKANSILKYREEHGEFQKTEDIMKIEGIKNGVFDKIKEQITV